MFLALNNLESNHANKLWIFCKPDVFLFPKGTLYTYK